MRNRAFTLIELLIVVAIIGILAVIAVPNFLEAQTRAKVSRVHADLRNIDTQLKVFDAPPETSAQGSHLVSTKGMNCTDPFTKLPGYSVGWMHPATRIVYSPGPVGDYTPWIDRNADSTIAEIRLPIHENISYDPTNGTVSRGYIYRAIR